MSSLNRGLLSVQSGRWLEIGACNRQWPQTSSSASLFQSGDIWNSKSNLGGFGLLQ